MKKFILATGAVIASGAIIFGATPALATPPANVWDDGILKGDVLVQISSDGAYLNHIYSWDDVSSSTVGDSTAHSMGELLIENGTYSFYPTCDTVTAVITDDNGATAITCDAQTPINNNNSGTEPFYAGLEVTPSYRVSAANADGIVLGRMAFALTNTTSADITLATVTAHSAWDERDYGTVDTNLGSGPISDDLTGSDYRWVNTAYFQSDNTTVNFDSTTFGAAWAGVDGTAMRATTGSVGGNDVEQMDTNFVVPANSTVYLAFYGVYAFTGINPFSTADDVYTKTNTYMATFDGAYEGELTAGLPADAYVANWEASPTPELPNTGATDMSGFAAGALAIVALGLGLVVVRRRRNA